MAITKSAKKAIKQSLARKERNIIYKDSIKKLVKEIKILISAKKNDEAIRLLPKIYSALDKAAKVGVIKKNNASRRKSRFTKLLEKNK